ncbi:MAG: DNA/RNA helicase domain-containing protein [Vicinamibacterales bacterium]
MNRPRAGWYSNFEAFRDAQPSVVRERLEAYVTDASPEQVRAWRDGIPPLQREVDEVLVRDVLAKHYSAILEYELPMESRRPDVILLVGGGVLVVELKGKLEPSQADIDQVAAYARDLKCYHRDCWNREVIPVLVPTRARGYQRQISNVHVAGPDALDALVAQLTTQGAEVSIDRARFLEDEAYCPIPTLVEAARELFESGQLRTIHRARAATASAVEAISNIAHYAAATSSRHLVLLTGVPGAGKTLVGLQSVHARYLDDLAVPRANGAPTTPAVFLSGNGPLVQVLQYELKRAGGDGKTFVRGVKDYVKRYSGRRNLVPPEHVLVFDEAQRTFDAAKVALTHKEDSATAKSEPEHFIEFAERIPGWCVVIGLIGSGQEIHVGEEGGLVQWRWAVERSLRSAEWTVHAPLAVGDVFEGSSVRFALQPSLNLDTELRFHAARHLHRFVAALLGSEAPSVLAPMAQELESEGYTLRLTRNLDVAKAYLRERYGENPNARFGMIASSKDRDLGAFGVPNDFQATKTVKIGPWYADAEDDPKGLSCRRLETCVTEFGAQGLELDAALLAWGTDLMFTGGAWSNAKAGGYRQKRLLRDARQLRVNAYRVLLTRARDGCVVFVPPLRELDETFDYLTAAGFVSLSGTSSQAQRT